MVFSRTTKFWTGTLIGGAAVAAAVFGYARYVRPRHLRWGATDDEVNDVLPGDSLSPGATSICTHALTINAPASAVWPWIVQLGQDRAGFYSYSWLENLVGADIHNIYDIIPEFQERKVGDTVWLGPKYRYGGQARLLVAHIDSGKCMVLVAPEDYDRLVGGDRAHGAWSFVLKEIDDKTTRFIMRGRGKPTGLKEIAIDKAIFEPAHFIMERKMMLTIKELAEKKVAAIEEKTAEKTELLPA